MGKVNWTVIIVATVGLGAAVGFVALGSTEIASAVAGGILGWITQPKDVDGDGKVDSP